MSLPFLAHNWASRSSAEGNPFWRRLFELRDDLDDAVSVAIELRKILSGNPILGVNHLSARG